MLIDNKIFLLLISVLFFSCNESKKESEKESPEKKDSVETEHAYVEEWDVYITKVDELPASILVDLGLYSVAPIADKFNFIYVTLKMKKPNENGLSSSEEKPILDEIDDAIYQSFTTKLKAINAGRLNTDGHLHFYFYVGDTLHFGKLIKEITNSFPNYEFKYGAYFDSEWNTYFDLLYPDPNEMQEISNRQLVEQLIENGDELTVPREVNHWIYFRTEEDRDRYIIKTNKEGFIVESKEYDKSEMEYPFSLVIKRVDKVDLVSVNEYVLFLRELALENNGEYDGWETSIVQEE
jgi:uncharacterized protein (TIGR01619 family)